MFELATCIEVNATCSIFDERIKRGKDRNTLVKKKLKNLIAEIQQIITRIDHRITEACYPGLSILSDTEARAALNSATPPPAEKQLTIVCVAYKRYNEIQCLLYSLLSQKIQNFKVMVLHDGYDQKMDDILSRFSSENPGFMDVIFSTVRHNDYGHSLREIGIQKTTTEYVLVTNDDNYYSPLLTQYVFNEVVMNKSPDIVMWNMSHGHDLPGESSQPPAYFFNTLPTRKYIDIGCFIAKTDLAQRAGFADHAFDADATYFEHLRAAAEHTTIMKLPAVLLVHN